MFQPPPPPPELLALPTITLMIAITFVMQTAAIFFNSLMVKEYKGVRLAFLATLAIALGFGALVLLGLGPQLLIGFASNLLITVGHILIYVAVCRFVERPLNRVLVYAAAALALVALPLASVLPIRLPLIFITQLVALPMNIASALLLLRKENTRFRLGARLTAIPFLIYAAITGLRIVTGILSPREVLPGPTLSNIVDVMSFYILSYLWIAGFILMISQRLQADLNDLAMNDALTRVRNRRAMQSLLDFEMRRVQTEVKDFSILLLDVDHFKSVNDTYGHDVGDIVLQWVAQTIQSALRVQDIVARWGGEEFLILLPGTTLAEAFDTAERLRKMVEASEVRAPTVTLRITFSGGAANSKSTRDVDKLCKLADEALYIAKQTRNRIVLQANPG